MNDTEEKAEKLKTETLKSEGKIFYFGCVVQTGHYLHDAGLRQVHHAELIFPFRWQTLDGGLLPRNGPQQHGETYLAIINGWTIVSLWDQSVDSGLNSKSAFIVEGIHTREEVMKMARLVFPRITQRIEAYGK